MESQNLVRIEEIAARGRGLFSAQPLRGGQIVLKDSPILLYSAFPFNSQHIFSNSSTLFYCQKCFRLIQSAPLPCPSCSHHYFCSPTCLSAAASTSHTPWVCQALTCLGHCPSLLLHRPVDRQIQARFLVAAYNVAFVSPSDFQILLSLQGHGEEEDAAAGQFLHSLISSLCPPPVEGSSFPFSLELTLALLAKDKINAFGLMEPLDFSEGNGGQRSVRAYGIYPKASLFNHDCLPNACRFDYVDSASDHNTDIIVRMIHDVPQGREISLSYFPVNDNYSTRQKRLLEDYGFICDCDRCKVEANWSSDDDDNGNSGGGGDGDGDGDGEIEEMEEDLDEPMDAASGHEANTDFPHAYFFLRYMCNRNNCWGTLAPLPPSEMSPSNLLECNVCGNIKNDEVVNADAGQPGLSMDH